MVVKPLRVQLEKGMPHKAGGWEHKPTLCTSFSKRTLPAPLQAGWWRGHIPEALGAPA